MDKSTVHTALIKEIELRKERMHKIMEDLLKSGENETKSSAGDKHETGRAMAQLEQEKIGKQILELNKISDTVFRLDYSTKNNIIKYGSLIETDKGWFYISVGIGNLQIGSDSVFCITSGTPLGRELINKKSGEQVRIGNNIYVILNVF